MTALLCSQSHAHLSVCRLIQTYQDENSRMMKVKWQAFYPGNDGVERYLENVPSRLRGKDLPGNTWEGQMWEGKSGQWCSHIQRVSTVLPLVLCQPQILNCISPICLSWYISRGKCITAKYTSINHRNVIFNVLVTRAVCIRVVWTVLPLDQVFLGSSGLSYCTV